MPLTPLNPTSLPDLSTDFLAWLNVELRKKIESTTRVNDEQAKNARLVNRLRTYLSDRIAPAT